MNESKLKYEHIQPGQRIRAYDHVPAEGRTLRYLEGEVQQHYTDQFGVRFLLTTVEKDTTFCGNRDPRTGDRVGLYVYVPMEIFAEDEEYVEVPRVQVI